MILKVKYGEGEFGKAGWPAEGYCFTHIAARRSQSVAGAPVRRSQSVKFTVSPSSGSIGFPLSSFFFLTIFSEKRYGS